MWPWQYFMQHYMFQFNGQWQVSIVNHELLWDFVLLKALWSEACFRQKILSREPRVFYYPHFLTDEECDHLIESAIPTVGSTNDLLHLVLWTIKCIANPVSWLSLQALPYCNSRVPLFICKLWNSPDHNHSCHSFSYAFDAVKKICNLWSQRKAHRQ